MISTRIRGFVALAIVVTSAIFALTVSHLARAEETSGVALTEVASGAPICRYGVNVTSGSNTFSELNMSPLRLGWYLNYLGTRTSSQPANIEFVPVIRLTQTTETDYSYSPNGAALTNAITANLGATWLIGNEPDRRGTIQDNVEPHVYAAAYFELYHLIKQADPTARVFAGTIVQPTPLRLRYLDMVLNSYYESQGQAMPVDGWSIHNFILNEVSCNYDPGDCWGADIPPGIDEPFGERVSIDDNDSYDRFVERIIRFRQWMKDRGYNDLPLYLTEYGILMPPDYGFGPDRVNSFMNKTFDYMTSAADQTLGYSADGYRLVQKWSWYSTTDQTYNGWLFDGETKQPTATGLNFATHSAPISIVNDLQPWKLVTSPANLYYSGTPLNIQIKARITNSGNPAVPVGPATVRFYNGDPSQGGVKIGNDQIVNLAGCGEWVEVSVPWNGVGAGVYQIFVVVDASNAISEINESNNTRSFSILVGTEQNFMPVVRR